MNARTTSAGTVAISIGTIGVMAGLAARRRARARRDGTFLLNYLNDHLAGSTAAVHLLEHMRRQSPELHLRAFFEALLDEIQHDRQTVVLLISRISGRPSTPKLIAASLSARLARPKFDPRTGSASGSILEALEALLLGIRGKLAMWDALMLLQDDPRLAGVDLPALRSRALTQIDRVEQQRLTYAGLALRRASAGQRPPA